MKITSIDVYTIEDRLRKSKKEEDKETWQYIKKLKEAYARQGDLVNKAISKVREMAAKKPTPSLQSFIARAREIASSPNDHNITLYEGDLKMLYNEFVSREN